MDAASPPTNHFRILSLDGGGAKGFYTLGVLNEIEAMMGRQPLCGHFDLIFGTSTGAIIAALLGLGYRFTFGTSSPTCNAERHRVQGIVASKYLHDPNRA